MTVTATDSAGNSLSQTGNVRVLRGSPVLGHVRKTHRVFRVGERPTKTTATRRRAPIGTTFHYSLDRPATVTIRIARVQPGRRAGKRCVRPKKSLRGRVS